VFKRKTVVRLLDRKTHCTGNLVINREDERADLIAVFERLVAFAADLLHGWILTDELPVVEPAGLVGR
jgi:hypothetical protein